MLKLRRLCRECVCIILFVSTLFFYFTNFFVKDVYAYPPASNSVDVGPILHAWCWKFNDVSRHINEIADAGYKSIQVSPIQKEKTTNEGEDKLLSSWWSLYQPLNFKIGNCLGTKEEFRDMCRRAHKVGLKIIVDVVANHLANGTGSTNYSEEIDPSLLKIGIENLFHKDGFQEDVNPRNRFCMTQKSIGMPDLNTGNKDVQKFIMDFLAEAMDCGADGFRFDAAKHIELPEEDGDFGSDFWPNIRNFILSKNPNCYIYGEVLNDDNITDMSKYLEYMDITDSKMGDSVVNCVRSKNVDNFEINYCVDLKDRNFVTWVESHDTYAKDGHGPTMDMSFDEIRLGWAIIASRKQSVPLYLARPSLDQLSSKGAEIMTGKMGGCGDLGWKNKTVVKINKFNVMMKNESEIIRRYGKNVYITERGEKGAIAVNLSNEERPIDLETNLHDGLYQGEGYQLTVENGRLKGRIAGNTVAIICSMPDVFISQHGGNYSDVLKLRLGNVNTIKSTYSVDDCSEKEFENGANVSIGEGKQIGEESLVRITGIDKNGNTVTKRYIFTKFATGAIVVELSKNIGWKNPRIYAYNDELCLDSEDSARCDEVLGPWPGRQMADSKDGQAFTYSLSQGGGWRVLVTDGGDNQFPVKSASGCFVMTGEKLRFEGPQEYKLSVIQSDEQ